MKKIVIFLYDRAAEDLIANTLRFGGYDVFAEKSAAAAWFRVQQVQPQLVITDFPAYVADDTSEAATLVEAIRADPVLHDIPLISVSFDASPEWLVRAEAAGVTQSVRWPADPADLLVMVRDLLAPTH